MASFDGLDRMKALLDALGNPEADFKAIHIAGTNGKGSTAVMIASILEEAGYSVGLYTSPHLETECERVQIWDGAHRMIEQDKLDALREKVRNAASDVNKTLHCGEPTVFEIYTAAAYLFFEEQKPDYVVLEVGLGGRLDSTNTIEKPLVTVITQIGLDHTAQLGSTIVKVAREKAGIIKPGVPVVSQTDNPAARNVIFKAAAAKGAEFYGVPEIYRSWREKDTPVMPDIRMAGMHQLMNAATAITAVKASGIEVPDDAIENGLEKAYLPGRFELIEPDAEKEPAWIIDGAHNPDAIDALAKTYTLFSRANKIERTLVIFGCMKDKNSVHMVQLLSGGLRDCSFAATAVDYERAEDPGRIAELFRSWEHDCRVFGTSREAYEYAKASGFECILVCGSIYLAGEMRHYLCP